MEDAAIEDSNVEAIKKQESFFLKARATEKAQEVLKNLSDIEVLYKAGITIKGKITRTTLLFSKKSLCKVVFEIILFAKTGNLF